MHSITSQALRPLFSKVDHVRLKWKWCISKHTASPPRPAQSLNPVLWSSCSSSSWVADSLPSPVVCCSVCIKARLLGPSVQTLLPSHPGALHRMGVLLSQQGRDKWFHCDSHVYIWEAPSPYQQLRRDSTQDTDSAIQRQIWWHFCTKLRAG